MACPHLKEVVMLFCDACPVRKMLPLDRLATGEPCLGEFGRCPFFTADGVAAGTGAHAAEERDVVLAHAAHGEEAGNRRRAAAERSRAREPAAPGGGPRTVFARSRSGGRS